MIIPFEKTMLRALSHVLVYINVFSLIIVWSLPICFERKVHESFHFNQITFIDLISKKLSDTYEETLEYTCIWYNVHLCLGNVVQGFRKGNASVRITRWHWNFILLILNSTQTQFKLLLRFIFICRCLKLYMYMYNIYRVKTVTETLASIS